MKSATTWGIFPSLFGLASNEVYWVVMSDSKECPLDIASAGIELRQHTTLVPTVRPVEHETRSKQGVYVFRWFNVDTVHLPQVVTLSDEAWQTFEGGFDTEVQGLFTTNPPMALADQTHAMVLVTWYENLTVWQESRSPGEHAKSRFLQRQSLMNSALPIATKLA